MQANWKGRGEEGPGSLTQEITSHGSVGLNAGAYDGAWEGLALAACEK